MKTLKYIIIGIALFLASPLQAQVSVSLNIGSPPPWGPVGYSEVRYYYLPDVEAYYDVQSSMFIYYSGRTWIHRKYLPRQYRSYDLYDGYKVAMTDYRGNTPYVHFTEYKTKYARGYHGQPQKNIGEKPGKGNSRANTPSNRYSNKKVSQDNGKSDRQGNDKNMKRNNDRGGRNDRKN
jgi:hypothetical protein